MIGYCSHATCNRRRAFTLMEVLLTMALLVILAALAWPALDKPIAGLRLRKAADQIRAHWATARVEAIDSGETYLFRFDVAGDQNTFRIECHSALVSEQNTVFGDDLGDSVQGTGTTGTAPRSIEDSLPEGVTFVGGETETDTDTRAAMITSELEQSAATETVWSNPILFYPDGTTSTARLVLKNEHDRYIELLLRGLTGVISISTVRGSEESMP